MLLSRLFFSQVPEYTFSVAEVVHQVVLETSLYQIMVLLSPLLHLHLVAFASVSFAALTQ